MYLFEYFSLQKVWMHAPTSYILKWVLDVYCNVCSVTDAIIWSLFSFHTVCTRATSKLMPPILLCWPTTSEVNVVDMAVEVEPSRQYSVKFCCRATDDSRGAVWQNGVWHGSAYETKVCNWIPPCGKKLHPMTFTDACWMFTETKQWMLA